jgi:hypothetical protein
MRRGSGCCSLLPIRVVLAANGNHKRPSTADLQYFM